LDVALLQEILLNIELLSGQRSAPLIGIPMIGQFPIVTIASDCSKKKEKPNVALSLFDVSGKIETVCLVGQRISVECHFSR
jgi:hypothetical protein